MKKIESTEDYSGRPMKRGDTVSTLNGQLTARICDIASDGDAAFVRLRALHQPYGPGVWHAADRVVWVAAATRRNRRRRRKRSTSATESAPAVPQER